MKKHIRTLMTAVFIVLFAVGLFLNHPRATETPSNLTAIGYGGPIQLKLNTTSYGKINNLEVLTHNETLSYVSKLEAFTRQFTGKTTRSPLELGIDIDAISGATITSRAITTAVREKLHAPGIKTESPLAVTEILIPLLLLALALTALILKNNPLRWAALTGGFVYFGIMTHTMLSMVQVAQAGLVHSPSFTENTLWWMLIIITFIPALVIGRIYCGSLCPFASIQEFLHQLTPHKYTLRETITPKLERKARLTKYILLIMIMGISLATGKAAAANIEPYVTLFTGYGNKIAWSLLALMLILGVFNFRFWCKYLCPVGALTSLTATFSFTGIKAKQGCTACGACTKICPTEAISTDDKGIPHIDTAECILCAKCLRTCPVNALTLGCRYHEKT